MTLAESAGAHTHAEVLSLWRRGAGAGGGAAAALAAQLAGGGDLRSSVGLGMPPQALAALAARHRSCDPLLFLQVGSCRRFMPCIPFLWLKQCVVIRKYRPSADLLGTHATAERQSVGGAYSRRKVRAMCRGSAMPQCRAAETFITYALMHLCTLRCPTGNLMQLRLPCITRRRETWSCTQLCLCSTA